MGAQTAGYHGLEAGCPGSTEEPGGGLLPKLADCLSEAKPSVILPLLPGTVSPVPWFYLTQYFKRPTLFSGNLAPPHPFPLQSWSLLLWPGAHPLQSRLEREWSTQPVCSPADLLLLPKAPAHLNGEGDSWTRGSSSVSHRQRVGEEASGRWLGIPRTGLGLGCRLSFFSRAGHCPQVPCKPRGSACHTCHGSSHPFPALGCLGLRNRGWAEGRSDRGVWP